MHKSNRTTIVLLMAPGLLVFCLAILFPLILSGYLGLTDSHGISDARFIGFQNFVELLTNDNVFWSSLLNALLLGLGYVLIQHPICVLLAVLLDKLSGKLELFFQILFFIPAMISVVVVTKLWVNVYNPSFGLLNNLLQAVGLGDFKQEWLADYNLALPSLLAMTIWIGFGYGFLLYYAGIKGVPEELYEAARIDGAGEWRVLFKITLPLLKPVIIVNVTLAMINALKQMEVVYLATGGGPANATQFVANYLYSKAFLSSEFGYANAISVVFALICLGLTIAFDRFTKKDGGLV